MTIIKTDEDDCYNGSIFHEGFKFHRKYVGKNSSTYWCAHNRNRDSDCQAKIKMSSLGKTELIGNHHISCFKKNEFTRKAMGFHDTFETEDSVPDLTEKMLERAEELALENISEKPKNIYIKVLRETQERYETFKGASNSKMLNRIKNSRTKQNGNDVFRTIEMTNLSKMKNSHLFFLQFNITFPNELADGKLERIIGFGNPSLFRVFGGNSKIFIDGTFKVCPKPFYQCLIIMVFDEQTDAFVPVFYVLLTSKNTQIYRHALYWIKSAVDYKMQPLVITCDYEKALHSAVKNEFPNANINGCLFHWKQAIRRKIKDLRFEESSVVDRFMHRSTLETLTIIPPEEIKEFGIPFVREIVDENLNENDMKKVEMFWEYFEKFWLGSPSWINSWNVHHQNGDYKKKLMRTNNGLERYNRSLKAIFQNSTPSLIGFVETLENESRVQAEKLDNIRKGLVLPQKRKRNTEIHPSEYSKPCLHYLEFVKDMKSIEN